MAGVSSLTTNDVLQWGSDNHWHNTNVLVGVEASTIVAGDAAQGDVLYFDNAKWARLAPGTSGQFLKTQGASANPVWADEVGITRSQGVTTRAGDAASSTQTIAHGLSSTPTHVRFTAMKNLHTTDQFFSMSVGVFDGTNVSCAFSMAMTGSFEDFSGTDTTNIIRISEDSGGGSEEIQKATITVTGTNIELGWTKALTPNAGIIRIVWEADF